MSVSQLLGFPGSSQPGGYAQTSYDTGDSHERAALKELLSTLDLNGVLIQADALHTSPSFFSSQQNRGPTCS